MSFSPRAAFHGVAIVPLLCIPLLCIHLSAQTPAAAPAVTWGAETDFNSGYTWQGISFNRGPVMQPEIWVSAEHLTLTLWGSQVLNGPRQGELTEYSIGIGYSRTWRGWTLEPSYERWVNRPANADTGPNTGVAILGISRKAGPVAIFTTQSLDIQSFRGAWWGDLGVSWEHSLGKALGKALGKTKLASAGSVQGASAKFNEAYIGPVKAAFNLFSAQFSASIPLPAHVYLRPHVEFTSLVDRELRASVSSPALWNAGLALGFLF